MRKKADLLGNLKFHYYFLVLFLIIFFHIKGRAGVWTRVWRLAGSRLQPWYVKPIRESGRKTQCYCAWFSEES